MRRRAEAVTPTTVSSNIPQSAEDQAYEVLFGGKLMPVGGKRAAKLPIERLCPFQTANIGFKPYSEEKLNALADDIMANGLVETIKVRPIAEGYEILSEHNRVAACKLLGWDVYCWKCISVRESETICRLPLLLKFNISLRHGKTLLDFLE